MHSKGGKDILKGIENHATVASDEEEQDLQRLKIYVLSVICALTRHVTLEVTANRTYDETKLALQRVFYERGAARLMISDSEPSFKAVSKDMSNADAKGTVLWLDGWKQSKEKADLEQSFGTTFRFQNAESPELNGLIKRFHKTITHSMLSLRKAVLRCINTQE